MNAPWTVESDDSARQAAFEAECFRLARMAQRNPQRRQESWRLFGASPATTISRLLPAGGTLGEGA
jgi:hypothetical protein